MLPSALEHVEEIAGAGDRSLAIFLDYDGTLTPIVSQPDQAVLMDSTRAGNPAHTRGENACRYPQWPGTQRRPQAR